MVNFVKENLKLKKGGTTGIYYDTHKYLIRDKFSDGLEFGLLRIQNKENKRDYYRGRDKGKNSSVMIEVT